MKNEKELFQNYNRIKRDVDWGEKFRILLTDLNRSMLSLASETGITDGGIYKILNKEYTPSFLFLLELCRCFHVSPDWLFYGDGNILKDTDRKRDDENTIRKRILSVIGTDRNSDFFDKTGLASTTLWKIKSDETPDISETTIHKIAIAYYVGFDWLLCGDEKCKTYPVDRMMINTIWRSEDLRKSIWEEMAAIPDTLSVYNEDLQTIGSRIRYCRKSREMSIAALSTISFISSRTIIRWENGQSKATVLGIRRLAEVLCVGEDYLLKGDESRLNYPCDRRMIEWLKEHPEVRAKIAEQ